MTLCIQPEGEAVKITPVEAEERAGLKNNKNWKKSLLTSHEVHKSIRCMNMNVELSSPDVSTPFDPYRASG